MNIALKCFSVGLALSMLISGGACLTLAPAIRETFTRLELPLALGVWLGGWKLAGAVVLLLPRRWRGRTLTDWTYAGFVFLLSGALMLHAAAGDRFALAAAPAFLLVLSLVAYALEMRSRMANP